MTNHWNENGFRKFYEKLDDDGITLVKIYGVVYVHQDYASAELKIVFPQDILVFLENTVLGTERAAKAWCAKSAGIVMQRLGLK